MQYRGVKIVRVPYVVGIDIGRRDNSPVKPIVEHGYSIVGQERDSLFPDTLEGCHASIDRLIPELMRLCRVSEQEAVNLLNRN